MHLFMITALLAAGTSVSTISLSPQIEMVIDDGKHVSRRKQLYPSLQSCLEDTQELFAENAHDVKRAWLNKTWFPKELSVTCRSRQINND